MSKNETISLKDAVEFGEVILEQASSYLGFDPDEDDEDYGDIVEAFGEYEEAYGDVGTLADLEFVSTAEDKDFGDMVEIIDDALGEAAGFGGGFADTQHGDIFDRVVGRVNKQIRLMLKPITGRYDRMIKAIYTRLNKQDRVNKAQDRQIRRLSQMNRRSYNANRRRKVKAQKNRVALAIMSASQSIPGLKAHAVAFGPTARSERAAQKSLSEAFEALTIADKVEHVPTATLAAYDAAVMNDTIDALEATIIKLATNQTKLMEELSKVKAEAEGHVSSIKALDTVLAPDSLTEVTRWIPSQFEDTKLAVMEGVGKYALGKEQPGLGVNLSLNGSTT